MNFKRDEHQGDLARLLSLQNVIFDKNSLQVEYPLNNAKQIQNIILPKFESGVVENYGEANAFAVNDKTLPRAFVFHDSFIDAIKPYLIENFGFPNTISQGRFIQK